VDFVLPHSKDYEPGKRKVQALPRPFSSAMAGLFIYSFLQKNLSRKEQINERKPKPTRAESL
jgi:hypothetical protein